MTQELDICSGARTPAFPWAVKRQACCDDQSLYCNPWFHGHALEVENARYK